MTELEQLTERLKALPRRQYVELIRIVDAERRKAVEPAENNHPPARGMSKDSFVQWIVRHHFAIDKGITANLCLGRTNGTSVLHDFSLPGKIREH